MSMGRHANDDGGNDGEHDSLNQNGVNTGVAAAGSPHRQGSPLCVRRQAGDGNCLFRSFSDQLYGTPEHHELIRDRCSKYIASEKNYFVQFVNEPFDKFIERIQREGEWGDDIEIEALSEIYDCRIEIYDSYTHRVMRTFHETCDARWSQPIRLQYEGRAHYNSLAPRSGLVRNTSRPGEIEDRAILRSKRRQEAGQGRLGAVEAEQEETDRELMDHALQDSRAKFEHKSQEEMDRVLEESRVTFCDKEVFDRELEDSKKGWLEEEQRRIENEMVNSIMQESAEEVQKNQYPESVYKVMSMGIPLEKCAKAYDLVGDDENAILDFCLQNLSSN